MFTQSTSTETAASSARTTSNFADVKQMTQQQDESTKQTTTVNSAGIAYQFETTKVRGD